MIKYYSTLTDTLHDKESEAQKAEDRSVEKYFEELDLRAAEKRRKLRHIAEKTDASSFTTHIRIH